MSGRCVPRGTPPAAAGSSLLRTESFSLAVTILGPREAFFPGGPNAALQLPWAWQSQAGLGTAPLIVVAAFLGV